MWNDIKVQHIRTHLITGYYKNEASIQEIQDDIRYIKINQRGLPSGWVSITIFKLEKIIKEKNDKSIE